MATYESRFNTTTGDQTFTGSIDPAGGFTGTGGLATDTVAGLLPPPTLMSDELATSLGFKEYFHGTNYNGGVAPTVSNMTVDRAVFIPYQTQAGEWRLRFNIVGVGTGNNDAYALTINGVLFKNITNYYQAIAILDMNTQGITGRSHTGRANPNTANLAILFETIVPLSIRFGLSGDVDLESKPTWAY